MKVLLTGASGFVGRALQDELRHADGAYEVHPLGRADGDLADEGVAEAAIAEARPDVVVHAAARIGVVRCDEAPELALRSNVLATTLVARAAATHGARLAYLSTSDVYGSAVEADEQTPPAPESLYALTKLWGEQAAALYAPEGLTILRLANPYGPGVEAGQAKGAVPTMLRQADARRADPRLPRRGAHLLLDRRRRARDPARARVRRGGRLQHRRRRRGGRARRRRAARLRADRRARRS